jgi:putative ABC transport system permease protein
MGQLIVKDSSHRLAGLADNLVALPRSQASSLLYPDRPGTSTRLDIRLKPQAEISKILPLLTQLVAGQGQARTVADEETLVGDVTTGMELGFTIGGIGSLVVGLFLVYNALAVSVAERRRDMGILRSCGATRPQLAGLFLIEASILGLSGSLIGIPLGMALAATVS